MGGAEHHSRGSRRTLLRAIGLGLSGATLTGPAMAQTTTEGPEPSVTFEDQESDGRSVVVGEVATNVEALLYVRDAEGTIVAGESSPIRFQAGTVETDIRVDLDDPIEESQRLTAILAESNGSDIASDDASVTVTGELPEQIDGVPLELVSATPAAGFEYPYFLYAPERYADVDPRPPLVQPNNTGTSTDDFERHREAARDDAEHGLGREVADELSAPLVVPVFPRPRSEPVDGDHYVHQLDDTTMAIEGGPLERVDLQLLAMVEDARDRLADADYPVADGLMLNGFSASGNFVNRFAALHPDAVTSVTAGGLNGMAILPLAEDRGHRLPYHVGVADVEALTGDPFDLEAFRDVAQFLYMGELDSNDTIPYTDAWTDDALRETALAVYGDDMQEDRFPYCKAVYRDEDVDAVFRIYADTGHSPRPAVDDVVAFHRRVLAGEDVDAIRADLGGNVPDPRATFSVAPERPAPGEQVAFDASPSAVWERDIVEYAWEFGDGSTASGELATHTYEEPGGFNVVLTVTDDAGESYRTVEQITVRSAGSGEGTATDANATETDATDEATMYRLFGVGGVLTGLGSLGYVLARRVRSDDD